MPNMEEISQQNATPQRADGEAAPAASTGGVDLEALQRRVLGRLRIPQPDIDAYVGRHRENGTSVVAD